MKDLRLFYFGSKRNLHRKHAFRPTQRWDQEIRLISSQNLNQFDNHSHLHYNKAQLATTAHSSGLATTLNHFYS